MVSDEVSLPVKCHTFLMMSRMAINFPDSSPTYSSSCWMVGATVFLPSQISHAVDIFLPAQRRASMGIS